MLNAQGYQYLEFDSQNRAVRRLKDVRVDLSAVAKGYGVDVICQLLAEQGYRNYLVEIGGELRVAGLSPRATAWRIGIERPSLAQGQVKQAIELNDVAVATSGDYRNYFEKEGVRYSHTLDPRTGYPVKHDLTSVTVVANSSAEADACLLYTSDAADD